MRSPASCALTTASICIKRHLETSLTKVLLRSQKLLNYTTGTRKGTTQTFSEKFLRRAKKSTRHLDMNKNRNKYKASRQLKCDDVRRAKTEYHTEKVVNCDIDQKNCKLM